MRIRNYPGITFAYMEIWAAVPFVVEVWYGDPIKAEDKGDIWGIGAKYRVEIPVECYGVHIGSSLNPTIKLYQIAGDERYEFKPGVNLVSFEYVPGDPPVPSPVPPPGTDPGRSIVIYEREATPLIVKGSVVIALEPDLMANLLDIIGGIVEVQRGRDNP